MWLREAARLGTMSVLWRCPIMGFDVGHVHIWWMLQKTHGTAETP
jgi:hypothetical protein